MKKNSLFAIMVTSVAMIGMALPAHAQNTAPFWSLAGNNNASATSSKLGTTNAVPLRLFTNNNTRVYIDSTTGNVGIGTGNSASGAYRLYATGSNSGIYGRGGTTYGVFGQGGSYGVYGTGSAYGLYGYGTGTYGYGVLGTSGYLGVYGSGANYGVFGYGSGTSGYGVYGSSSNIGTYGYGGTYGLYGYGTGTYGYGVLGTGYLGVYGTGSSYGLYGYGTGTYGYGVLGTGYLGVYGTGTSNGVYGYSSNSSNGSGVYGTCSNIGTYGYGGNYGLYGTGYNTYGYGVYGTGWLGVYGTGSAYGVYGYSCGTYDGIGGYFYSCNSYGIQATSGKGFYAARFDGNVWTSGGYYSASDRRLKNNIEDFGDAMSIINRLKPKNYEFKNDPQYASLHLPSGKRYGLIAQDLEQVLPGLVHNEKFTVPADQLEPKSIEGTSVKGPDALQTPKSPEGKDALQTSKSPEAKDANQNAITPEGKNVGQVPKPDVTGLFPTLKATEGTSESQTSQSVAAKTQSIEVKTVDYEQLIPIMIEAMQEQDKKIEVLTKQLNELTASKQSEMSDASAAIKLSGGYLEQSRPNPTAGTANIPYNNLPAGARAQLFVSDANGKMIKQIQLSNSSGTVNLDVSSLSPGSYTYSLLINGKLMETKTMQVNR